MNGRDVIVTGGTGGLGTAVVGLFLDAGARVHVPYTNAGRIGQYPHRDRVALTQCDLTREDSVEALYASVPALWASVHLAGGFEMADIEDARADSLRRMMEVNVMTCFLCCRSAARRFGEGGGRIVNVAARPALDPRQGAHMSAYAASKAAVSALTQALASELAPGGVLVNAVAPSTIDTPSNREAMPDAKRDRWVDPHDIARTILFLCSEESRATSGAVVPVFGPG